MCKAHRFASLIHFVSSTVEAQARWPPRSALERDLNKFNGDVVQAVQALKESRPELTAELLGLLRDLLNSFRNCAAYCSSVDSPSVQYPFARAERQVGDVISFLYPQATQTQPTPSTRHLSISKSMQAAKIETVKVGPYEMPRLFNGLWQLSSPAWGSASVDSQERDLVRLIESGLTAADMADHYGDAELVYGDLRNRLPVEIQSTVYAATKWCIFGPINRPATADFVLDGVKERCRRLGGRVELLQLHWYDYSDKQYLDLLAGLVAATRSHPQLVSAIGLCNFDSEHTEEACEHLLQKTGAVGLVSNQIQFSLLDTRPLQRMSAVCDKYGLKLLTYGSFCGGFISSEWLSRPVPSAIYSEATQLTPSQRKYYDMIQTWGTWDEFQQLLETLSLVARRRQVTLTNVAIRWVLQQPAVGAVIVGTRLGVSNHATDNLNAFKFNLSDEDMAAINEVALGPNREKADSLFKKLGDCGNEYRATHD